MIDNWTKEFFAFCEAVNQEMENVFVEIEQFTAEVEATVTEELEEFWYDWEALWDELDSEIDWSEPDDSEFVITAKVTPDQNTHPACQGCQHYHGYVYGGNLFVCAMHPYGWDDENCPDWEKDNSIM